MQRPNPIRVPDHAGKPIHVLLKSQRALTLVPQLHLGLPRAKPEAPELLDSQSRLLRPSDSVVLSVSLAEARSTKAGVPTIYLFRVGTRALRGRGRDAHC